VGVQGQLCADCFGRTGFVSAPMCTCCGVPFPTARESTYCPTCEDSLPAFGQARAALRYDKHSRALILPFKHADRIELAPVLAGMMARAGAALLQKADVLVPVPLHRKRLFHRKYNQAALLALALGRVSGRRVQPDALQRTRATSPLEDKSPEERAAEVDGSFQVRPARVSSVAERNVVLVDDVMTSGATANACARALLSAGAASVDVLVAARVPDPRLS